MHHPNSVVGSFLSARQPRCATVRAAQSRQAVCCYAAAASAEVGDDDSDIEWMDSQPVSESQLPSHHPNSAEAAAAAPKPPLPPARTSSHSRAQSGPVGNQQSKQQVGPSAERSAASIGRHQLVDRQNESQQHQPSTSGLDAQDQSAGAMESLQSPQLGKQQSLGNQPGLSQSPGVPPAGSPGSDQQPGQQASPITSPFKKVPSPWEKDDQAAPAHRSGPLTGRQLLGKRKQRGEAPQQASDPEAAVARLHQIMSRTDSSIRDKMRDSVLLDTLKAVPDDQPMPISLEDRGMGLGETAAGNSEGKARKALGQHTKGSPRGGAQHPIDMTADDHQPIMATGLGQDCLSQPLSFDENDDSEFESGLIAAVERSSSQRARSQLNEAQQGGSAAVDAGATQDPHPRERPPPAPPTAPIPHSHPGPLQEGQNQETLEQQQQVRHHFESSIGPGGVASDGWGRPHPPSELGLGGYGSAALDPGPSGGVSSTLPSFDLDAELDNLDQQAKVRGRQQR